MSDERIEFTEDFFNHEDEKDYICRFVKLFNGDDLLCMLPPNSSGLVNGMQGTMRVRFPMKINTLYDSRSDQVLYVFMPWIPFTREKTILINMTTVVTITPIETFIEDAYRKRIAYFEKEGFSVLEELKVNEGGLGDINNSQQEDPSVVSPGDVLRLNSKKKPWLN